MVTISWRAMGEGQHFLSVLIPTHFQENQILCYYSRISFCAYNDADFLASAIAVLMGVEGSRRRVAYILS